MRYTLLPLAILLFTAPSAGAQSAGGARLDGLKVLSDRMDDVTTPENILKSFVKPGMTDDARAKALWTAVVRYRHQTAPPNEYLAPDWEAHDPVKLFNVYGYCMCCCCSAMVEALNRLDGREARGRILNGHSVPEVKYGGAWHMFDASLINYFPKPDTGEVASVDEISDAVTKWLDAHPDARGNLMAVMRKDGWTGWKSDGPALLAANPFYSAGYWPARTHGWDSTMTEYRGQRPVYDYGYMVGHKALFSLRPGESLERDAGNRGLHVNGDPGFDQLKARAPENDLVYVEQFMPGYHGPVVGNGYHRYAPDLGGGGLARGADVYQNLACGGTPALHLAAGGKPGVAVIEMSCPYVYLGGRVNVQAYRKSAADSVVVSLSTNNARTYRPLWAADKVGTSMATVDLGPRILRRYAYWLKVEVHSATPLGAGLQSLSIENDIQHAPRSMAWLGKGSNTVTVAADGDRSVRTRSIACRITPDSAYDKNESTTSMGAVFDNVDLRDDGCWWKGEVGTMTVPIRTPGNLAAVRFSMQVRVRGDKDTVKALLSFDDGKTWQEAGRITGPTPGTTGYFRFDKPPAGSRAALLRFEMTGNNTVGIFSFRADADYHDPLASPSVRPFTVTHRWKENGEEKVRTVTVDKLPYTYHITTQADPDMVSTTYAMPAR